MLLISCSFIDVYYCLGEPHIMEPVGGPPLGNECFVSLMCGQDVELPNLTETTTILMVLHSMDRIP